MKFTLAPLHGITHYHFRNCLNRHVKGFDLAVTPFLAVQETAKLNVRKWPDIQPENNDGIEIIPQLIGNTPQHFTDTITALQQFGYQRFNWNIGCPSAQVVRKQRGCGVMPHPEIVENVTQKVTAYFKDNTSVRFSIKMRLGWQTAEEGLEIINRLNSYPLDFICIHPRLGTQEYRGIPDWDMFEKMCKTSCHRIVYSGDIVDLKSYQRFTERFPQIDEIMLGRGLLRNIFLAEELIQEAPLAETEKRERFAAFYEDFVETMVASRGEHGTLSLLKELWHYFATFFGMSENDLRALLRLTEWGEFTERARIIVKNP